jgi:phosphatidylglycerol:prolipoprotein diacylglycerol transferase
MTPMLALAFPNIDPVLIHLGPLAIRWYALAYIAGLFGGIYYMRWLVKSPPSLATPQQVDDLLLWLLGGIVLGGRLGYVLFYKAGYYLANPVEIFKTWEGGMSFHGGLLGVIIAIMLFARHAKLNQWYIADNIGCAVPIGLGFGRIANFINGELWGRPTDVAWAMIFPGDERQVPRHPSQLYQAFFEGLVLFVIIHLLWRNERIRNRPGVLTGCFCIGYGIFRMIGETFREPDAFIGFMAGGTTMGQWLSLPMILAGAIFIWRAKPLTTTP